MPIEMPRGLPFSVDTWSPSSMMKRHHFLTHAHKDHCSAISSYSSYPIYCTLLTKSLLLLYYPELDESIFEGIEVGQSITIDDPDGAFSVTAFDANHCPGAVMFLFEGKFGNILHTGDCRLTLECLQKLPLKYLSDGGRKPTCRLDYVFLDCTFGSSPLRIPSKHSAVQEVINCIWRHPDASEVYLTCDLLGQEEVLINVFQTFGSKIYVDEVKHPEYYKVLERLAPEILSCDPSCRFWLFNGFPRLYERAQQKILEAKEKMQPEPLIIRPSAQWYACEETELTVAEKRKIEKTNEAVRDRFGVWHVCYSMHSSKPELEMALRILVPKWVVSTTPDCRAMELDYVKKNCLISQVASDDPLWKLLDIRVEDSLPANVQEEGDRAMVANATRSVSEAKLQLSEVSSSPKINMGSSPLRNKSTVSVTLFGRARLGLDFSTLYEEKKDNSVKDCTPKLVIDEMEKQLQIVEDDVEVNTQKSADDITRVDAAESRDLEVTTTTRTTPVSRASQEDVSERNDLKVGNKNKNDKSIDHVIALDADEPRPNESAGEERAVCGSVSYYPIGSSKGYSDSLRMMYRSMHAPVPRPLPSLVELMNATKRARKTS